MATTNEGRRPSPRPSLAVAPGAWTRHRARVLEPTTAVQFSGQPTVHPTAYIGDTLLVRRGERAEILDDLRRVARGFGYYVQRDQQAKADRRWLAGLNLTDEQRGEISEGWVERLRLVPDRDQQTLVRPEDAWRILQAYRLDEAGRPHADRVGLEHLVSATTREIGGTPYTLSHSVGGAPYTLSHGVEGTPYTLSHAVSGYGLPGLGGRQPVNWVGPAPQPRIPPTEGSSVRRPVVAVLDTGVGAHPWLDDGHVLRDLEVAGVRLDIAADRSDSETVGWSDPLLQELDPDAGHGTFIAGLIRQACPDATVLAVRLFRGDGVVGEWDLLRALQMLTVRHLLAMNGDERYQMVDVVSLSLGYYHEQPDDAAYSSLLREWVRLLGKYGVCLVAAAGNDATTRPMYPGAFAPVDPGPKDRSVVPVVCVGAENPDGSVALFSNAGPWVQYVRPGAALVSTYPVTVEGAGTPAAELVYDGVRRSSIDPDDFSSGFAVWSGTSFAAPVFAGELAARLLDLFAAGDDDKDVAATVARTRELLASMPKAGRR